MKQSKIRKRDAGMRKDEEREEKKLPTGRNRTRGEDEEIKKIRKRWRGEREKGKQEEKGGRNKD